VSPPPNFTPRERVALICRAATLLSELLPFAKLIESDAFTLDERDRFRELAGNGRVFALAEALRPLCSAEAHALHRARTAGIALTVIDTRSGYSTTKTFPRLRYGRTARRKR
jgi:hypothetical protein